MTTDTDHSIDVQSVPEDDHMRGHWRNSFESILSMVGFVVGLGNVWRFPSLVLENGGGAFIIAYAIMTFFVSLPLVFLELCLGQYTGQGPIKVFGRLAPGFKGLGYAMIAVSCIFSVYYNVVMAWTVFYIGSSFQSPLPWSYCPNGSHPQCTDTGTGIPPSAYFFNHTMLGNNNGITWTNSGSMRWELAGCLLASWSIICLSLIGGIKTSGRIVYVTVLLPFIGLLVFFVFGLTNDLTSEENLETFSDLLNKYFHTNLTVFWKDNDMGKVWKEAAKQALISLNPTMGGWMILASYNEFKTNCHWQAITVTLIDFFTSILAGMCVLALGKNSEVTGLEAAFVVYPESFSKVQTFPQLWPFIFFTTMFFLGLDSMFVVVETVITTIIDHSLWLKHYKPLVVIGTCFIGFSFGLCLCTQGGIHIFKVIHENLISWNCILFGLLQLFVVVGLYGPNKFMTNIQEMGMLSEKNIRTSHGLGRTTATGQFQRTCTGYDIRTCIKQWYWKICWCFITPLILIVLLFNSLFSLKERLTPLEKGILQACKKDLGACGGIIPMGLALIIPIVAIGQLWLLWKKNTNLKDTLLGLFKTKRLEDWNRLGGRRITGYERKDLLGSVRRTFWSRK